MKQEIVIQLSPQQVEALTIDEMCRIRHLRLSNVKECFARDLFLFSFYTRGMAFVDMAYLQKQDLHDGILTYKRHKTGQRLSIKWEPAMQRIVNHYVSANKYLLPIIHTAGRKERSQYRNVQNRVNRLLKTVAAKTGVTRSLSMYWARHSWATPTSTPRRSTLNPSTSPLSTSATRKSSVCSMNDTIRLF